MPQERYCIIGAGPAGLAQARAFRSSGIPYDQFEKHEDLGGLWDIENPGSPIYENCRLISSKKLSAFHDFPMSSDFPDYPSHGQVLEYLKDFAEYYGLYENISFGHAIKRIDRVSDEWHVTFEDGENRPYSGVVCASGMNWKPRLPEYRGHFSGEILHAVDYRHQDFFRGRRVLIIGGGNSGCDIACDAANNAKAAFWSLRRGYHIIPKYVFGIPADLFASLSPSMPARLQQRIFQALLRVVTGGHRKYGLPAPDHGLLECHPIINSDVFKLLRGGALKIKPDVQEFDGQEVRFSDGTRESIDMVLYATGYESQIPFLDPQLFEWKNGKLAAPLSAFNRHHPTLFSLGFLVTNAGVFEDFDRIANLIACYAMDRGAKPDRARKFEQIMVKFQDDLSAGLTFLPSARHATYVEHSAFREASENLRKTMGWPGLSPHR